MRDSVEEEGQMDVEMLPASPSAAANEGSITAFNMPFVYDADSAYNLYVVLYAKAFLKSFHSNARGMHHPAHADATYAYSQLKNYPQQDPAHWCKYLACRKVAAKEKHQLLFLMGSVAAYHMSSEEQQREIRSLRARNGTIFS